MIKFILCTLVLLLSHYVSAQIHLSFRPSAVLVAPPASEADRLMHRSDDGIFTIQRDHLSSRSRSSYGTKYSVDVDLTTLSPDQFCPAVQKLERSLASLKLAIDTCATNMDDEFANNLQFDKHGLVVPDTLQLRRLKKDTGRGSVDALFSLPLDEVLAFIDHSSQGEARQLFYSAEMGKFVSGIILNLNSRHPSLSNNGKTFFFFLTQFLRIAYHPDGRNVPWSSLYAMMQPVGLGSRRIQQSLGRLYQQLTDRDRSYIMSQTKLPSSLSKVLQGRQELVGDSRQLFTGILSIVATTASTRTRIPILGDFGKINGEPFPRSGVLDESGRTIMYDLVDFIRVVTSSTGGGDGAADKIKIAIHGISSSLETFHLTATRILYFYHDFKTAIDRGQLPPPMRDSQSQEIDSCLHYTGGDQPVSESKSSSIVEDISPLRWAAPRRTKRSRVVPGTSDQAA